MRALRAGEMSEYLDFVEADVVTKKTRTWIVYRRGGGQLGNIEWFSRWRQYCFFPSSDTVWSRGCLADVISFIEAHKDRR